MLFTLLLILVLTVPTVIVFGGWMFKRRGVDNHDRPRATEGGSPTVYRHLDDQFTPTRT